MDYFIIMIKHYLLSLVPYFSVENPTHMLLNLSAVKVRRFTFSGLSVKIIGMQNCAVQFKLSYGPRREKTCLRGFRQGEVQTSLLKPAQLQRLARNLKFRLWKV